MTTTITKIAITIPCKTKRHKFIMEVGKKYSWATFSTTLPESDLTAILKSIN